MEATTKTNRDPRYNILFEPVQIGPVQAKNRFYQVPHCNGAGYKYPNTVAAMRGTKAEGGWGVVNTEFCSIHPVGDPSPTGHARLWSDVDIAPNAMMVDAVHKYGALAGCETVITGHYSHNRDSRETAMSASPHPSPLGDFPSAARALDRNDIKNIRLWHRNGVRRAKQAGFDIVYIYLCHGISILHDFLLPKINHRTDEYGGSLENRLRLTREIIQDTREVVDGKCAVAIRFSLDDLMGSGGLSKEQGKEVMHMLAEEPDLWDLTLGTMDSPSSRFEKENWLEPYLEFVKSVSSKPVVAIGRFTSPDTMVSMVRRGLMDLVGAARPSIADPFLPKKIDEGRIEDIRECIGCNICLASQHMVTPSRCTQNPTMMEEWRRNWHPEKVNISGSKSTVLIVGAGPAGLEAAHILGKRGFQVNLAEAGKELGGHLLPVSRLPGLSEWIRVRDYRIGQLQKLTNVEIYRDSELDAEQILSFGFDHVALATGSKWRRDGIGRCHTSPIPGCGSALVLTPEQIMEGCEVRDPVVIFDDDHYYMGGLLSEVLLRRGHDVTIVTPASLVSSWTTFTFEQRGIQARLMELGLKIHANMDVAAIGPDHVTLSCVFTQRKEELAAGSIVMVTTRQSNDSVYTALLGSDEIVPAELRSLTKIGDCFAPGILAQSIYSAHRYGRELDEVSLPVFNLEQRVLED
ncbi:FAD-dependent oxidoreductase [Mesorhizobium sp. M0578]|uniref:oxidoreductase n=1 Tax=unclassified Mesorhizobium TaxID=325217 RepID=UPI0033397A4B